ncbi:MAG: hypothetical protein ACTSU5_11235 [Promethearchaeota archaeon]
MLMEEFNALGVTPPVVVEVGPYFGRLQRVPKLAPILDSLREALPRGLRDQPAPLGTVDQFVDSPHVLSDARLARRALAFFE